MIISTTGLQKVQIALNTLASDETQRRVLTKLANAIANNSKQRVRAQTDLSGNSWEKRKDAKRKKMLVKTGQQIRTISVSSSEALIGFTNPVFRRIAATHQFGISETVTVSQVRRRREATAELAAKKSTTKQAKALLAAGFKIRKPGGGFKTPTQKWITEHLTIQQAGLILADLQHTTPSTAWVIPLPERNFLGVTPGEFEDLANIALNEMTPRGN